MTQIQLPYNKNSKLSINIPEQNALQTPLPKATVIASSPRSAIKEALKNPVGTDFLENLVNKNDKVLLIVDDLTRETPVREALAVLTRRLLKIGVRKKQIKILIALGTHRYMSEGEIITRFGGEINKRFEIINHAWDQNDQLINLGITKRGTPIEVNKLVKWADFILGIGSIRPHHMCGFSGGAKIVQPGISSFETTARTHLEGARAGSSFLGEIENPVREEMDEIALKTGMKFILNFVLDSNGEVVKAFFGDVKEAFRKGARLSKEVHGVSYQQETDIVIANSYPAEIEFWQAHKSLYPADRVCKSGGIIIVVTPCPEGVTQTHGDLLNYASLKPEKIEQKILNSEVKDKVAAALALGWSIIRENHEIILVSEGISNEATKKLGFGYAESVEEALKITLDSRGTQASITILPCAPETLPVRGT